MKKLLLILMLTAAGTTRSMSASIIAEADSAYANDDFVNAAAMYQQAIDSLGADTDRLYNLGNAYYRAGLNGMAIVSYERALRLDPVNEDVKDNLEFVRSQTVDQIVNSESLVGGALTKAGSALHPNAWAVTGIILFALALAGILAYFFASGVMVRKVCFFGSGVVLLLCVGANILARRGTRAVTSGSHAVVVSPSVILSTTPRQPKDRNEEALLLHEGTKVEILDSIPGSGDNRMWYDVRVDNSHRAWISSADIVII